MFYSYFTTEVELLFSVIILFNQINQNLWMLKLIPRVHVSRRVITLLTFYEKSKMPFVTHSCLRDYALEDLLLASIRTVG